MAADYSRIHRLLQILTLVQGESGWTAERLAQECEVTPRTIYRDLKMLNAAGIPIMFEDETRCYRILPNFFMPPVSMTLEESMALVALADLVGMREQIPFMRAAGRAISKVRSNLPYSIRQQVEKLEAHIAIRLPPTQAPECSDDVHTTIKQAVERGQRLLCEYEPAQGQGESSRPFEFEPYSLFFSHRAWYAIGRRLDRDGVRTLKLNRFSRCQLTQTAYDIPEHFSLQEHLGHAWRMIRGKDRYEVEIVFDPTFAETIADTHWHATQEIQWQEDGSILFRCTVDGLDEIVWWILGMGPHCRVIKPEALAQRVRELACRMAELYGQDHAPCSGNRQEETA